MDFRSALPKKIFGRSTKRLSFSHIPGVFLAIVRSVVVMRNPVSVLKHYIARTCPESRLLETRDGLVVHLSGDSDDVVTALLILARQDYGRIPKGVVIDVGSNIGVFTLHVLNQGATRCYSFEPDPHLVKVVQKNVLANKFSDRAVVFQKAVTGLHSDGVLFLPEGNASGRVVTENVTESIKVLSVTLDDLIAENGIAEVALLKLDCEGSEYEIIQHTKRSTWDKILEVRLEYHNGQTQLLIDQMKNHGFYPSWSSGGEMRGMLFFKKAKAA